MTTPQPPDYPPYLTQADLIDGHVSHCEEARALIANKNHDYAEPSSPAGGLGNLAQVELMGLCSTEEGIIVRLSDKLSRLSNIIRKGNAVKSESVHDTGLDIINYTSFLLTVYDARTSDPPEAIVCTPDNPLKTVAIVSEPRHEPLPLLLQDAERFRTLGLYHSSRSTNGDMFLDAYCDMCGSRDKTVLRIFDPAKTSAYCLSCLQKSWHTAAIHGRAKQLIRDWSAMPEETSNE